MQKTLPALSNIFVILLFRILPQILTSDDPQCISRNDIYFADITGQILRGSRRLGV